jgi:hypothetical protein
LPLSFNRRQAAGQSLPLKFTLHDTAKTAPVLTLRFEKCTSTKDTAECRYMVWGFFSRTKGGIKFPLA